MSATADNEIKETWPRFLVHWGAATGGYFIRAALPLMTRWTDPSMPIAFSRWWVYLLIGAALTLVAGAINSNMPVKPREIVKSIGLGFAVDAVAVLAKLTPAG